MMKPEPSELVLCGCSSRSPPPLPPLRFLKKSSKNSSNGEPGGSCGMVLRPSPPPLASTVCEVEMLTTASITFSATSAMPSGPRAEAGEATTLKAPSAIAASPSRTQWRKRDVAMVAAVMFRDLQRVGDSLHTALEQGDGASTDLNGPQDADNTAKNRSRRFTLALAAEFLAVAPHHPDQDQAD